MECASDTEQSGRLAVMKDAPIMSSKKGCVQDIEMNYFTGKGRLRRGQSARQKKKMNANASGGKIEKHVAKKVVPTLFVIKEFVRDMEQRSNNAVKKGALTL